MGSSSSCTTEATSLRPHVLRTQNNGSPRSAVILGPTGATGKFIVSYLILSPEWSKVTIVHRREVDLDEIAKKCNVSFDESQKAKVTQHVVDMEKMCENEQVVAENADKFKDHDVTFCVLGTTRGKSGSAENFRKVDQYMVRDGAILSKRAGVSHFSLLTSKGAKAGMWANDWKVTHGLLYLKVKGDAEQAVLNQKFPRTSIFRPGFLARDGNADSGFISKLDVRDLAAVMLYDAETEEVEHAVPSSDDQKEQTSERVEDAVYYETDHIDLALPLARANYNEACRGEEEAQTEEIAQGNDVEEEKVQNVEKQEDGVSGNVDAEKESKEPEPTADAGSKEEPKKEENAEEAVKEDNDNFEVVDKPNDTPDDAGNAENEDFVEVNRDDVDGAKVEQSNE